VTHTVLLDDSIFTNQPLRRIRLRDHQQALGAIASKACQRTLVAHVCGYAGDVISQPRRMPVGATDLIVGAEGNDGLAQPELL
jgi:hypothetical protein